MITAAQIDAAREWAGLAAARDLGRAHAEARRRAYELDGDDSAELLAQLGETSPTTEANEPRRLRLLEAYREAYDRAAAEGDQARGARLAGPGPVSAADMAAEQRHLAALTEARRGLLAAEARAGVTVPRTYTRDQVSAAVNAGADLVTGDDQIGGSDRDRDLIGLAVHAMLTVLDYPTVTLDEVIRGNYDSAGDAGAVAWVRGWWDGWS